MNKEQFLGQVGLLRASGKSIRAIALELNVHRSNVERALKYLGQGQAGELVVPPGHARPRDRLAKETFVGRQREMGLLLEALEDARSGQGQLVMLVGEPGVGKTRTAEELAAYAEKAGAQILLGWCYEESGAPPYWPWVQPLRSYIQHQDPDQLRSQMGAGAADIAEIIPEVREKLPGLEPSPVLEPEQARFRLFDSITAFLKNASQTRPLMLVLDDLHWADRPSLLLLQFLARQLKGARIKNPYSDGWSFRE